MSASTKYESIPESVADEWRASPLSILFFSWLYPLLKVGAARPLQRSDLGASPTYDRVARHAAAFERRWASTRKTLASLTTVFWSRMRKGVACKAIGKSSNSHCPPPNRTLRCLGIRATRPDLLNGRPEIALS